MAAQYWLLKTEPSTYSFEQLVREKRTRWDGNSNAQALIHLRSMKAGDQTLIYHSGNGKALIGLARVVKPAYPDPAANDPKLAKIPVVV